MKRPRKACPSCGKDCAVYDTRRAGSKIVDCDPWLPEHKCPHGKWCYSDPEINKCEECVPIA